MYTVLVIDAMSEECFRSEGYRKLIDTLAEVIGENKPDAGKQVAFSMTEDSEWVMHKKNIVDCIKKLENYIFEARRLGCELWIDIAVGPEDAESKFPLLYFDKEFLSVLNDHKIAMEVSIYLLGD